MASGNFNLQSWNNSHKFSHLETFCTNCANKIHWKPLLPKQLKCISEETYWTINFSRFRSKFLLIRTLQKKYRIDRCANGQIAKVQYIGQSQISMQNTNGKVVKLQKCHSKLSNCGNAIRQTFKVRTLFKVVNLNGF